MSESMSDKSRLCDLTLTADDRRTWFEVYDSSFSLVASGGGKLTLSLPTGLYEVHSERAGTRDTEILRLAPDRKVERHVSGQAGPTLLPIRSLLRPEQASHAAAMAQATSAMKNWWLIGRHRARIVVMLRQPGNPQKAHPTAGQAKSVSLLDPARRTVRKFSNRWALDEVEGYAITRATVAPGCYTLRVADSAGASEQSIVAMPGRQTIVVAPLFMDGPKPDLATITMCHARESWDLVPEEHLLWSESTFSRLRRGRLPMTEEDIASARTFFDADPLLAIIAATSLALDEAAGSLTHNDGPLEEPGRIFSELLTMLRRTSARHPDVHMLLQAAGPTRKPVRYPPMFADTYAYYVAALHTSEKSKSAISEGSYAENACAAAFQGGVFLRWPTGDAASTDASPTGVEERAALLDGTSFTRSAVESLFQRSAGQAITQGLVTICLATLARAPLINRSLTGLMRVKAGWESRDTRRLAAEKVILYGQQVAALRRGSTALTLTRIADLALSDGSGVPISISARIRNHIVAHLGGEMTDQQTSPDGPVRAHQDSAVGSSRRSNGSGTNRPLPILIAAIVVLLGFAALVGWMLATANTANGVLWDRQLYIFTSVEAIVAAAAGALFGVEVKRQQATGAEHRADAAADRAAEALQSEKLASTEAERARALAAATRGAAAASRAAGGDGAQGADVPGARAPVGGTAGPDAALTALASIANELFPPAP